MTDNTDHKKPTFFRDLLDRRFPQIVLIYLGVCWTTLEFVSWIVEHYMISPYLTDFSFITLISMVPTVGMLAYFHGRPGRDEWTRTEKIGIPINVIFTGILIFTIFSGKELGSATTEVCIKNEAGQTIQREIPKAGFQKRLAVFFFDNETGIKELEWLQYAFMAGCNLDLNQDPFFSVYSAYDNMIYQKILQAGFSESMRMPMSLEKKIAKDILREYFLGGSFTVQKDTFIVSTYLYETKRGRLLSEHTIRNINIFSVIDQICVDLKKDLGLPGWHIESVEDLPISEILTSSADAFREYITGTNLIYLRNDFENATPHFLKAVQTDPGFAIAHWALYKSYINENRPELARKELQTTMQYLYKLPENLQFGVKEEYYLISEDPDKLFAILNMWVQLYPRDIRGHFRLARELLKKNLPDKAIKEYKTIMQIDSQRKYYLRYIGNIYLTKGDFKEALKYLKLHKKEYPKKSSSYYSLGELFFIKGDYEQAKKYYTDAQIIDPSDISVPVRFGLIETILGNYDKALEQFDLALASSKTPQEKYFVYDALQYFYYERGQIEQAFDNRKKKFAELAKYLNPVDLMINKVSDMSFNMYVTCNNSSEGFKQLADFHKNLSQPWAKYLAFGYLDMYVEMKDIEQTEKYIDDVLGVIRIFSEENKMNIVCHAQGKISELREDYINAVMKYQQQLQYVPINVTILTDIARCYRLLGESSKSRKFLETTLKIFPNYAPAHCEMARMYIDTGENDKALEHLEIARKVWEKADANYKPAKEMREILRIIKKDIT